MTLIAAVSLRVSINRGSQAFNLPALLPSAANLPAQLLQRLPSVKGCNTWPPTNQNNPSHVQCCSVQWPVSPGCEESPWREKRREGQLPVANLHFLLGGF